jgi:hypothetical protein
MARRIEDKIGRAFLAQPPACGRSEEAKQRTVRRAIELDSAPLRRLWRQCLTWAWTQISSESTLSSALQMYVIDTRVIANRKSAKANRGVISN